MQPTQAALPHLFHHLLHLGVLLQQPIDLLDGQPGAPGNPAAPGAIDDPGPAPLPGRSWSR